MPEVANTRSVEGRWVDDWNNNASPGAITPAVMNAAETVLYQVAMSLRRSLRTALFTRKSLTSYRN